MNHEIINQKKKELGLNNAQIAERAGITLSTMDKITSGANQNPKLDTLFAIADVLGLTLDDFDDRQKHEDTIYISRPSGDPTVDELRKQLHQYIDELDEDTLKNFTGLFIKMKE